MHYSLDPYTLVWLALSLQEKPQRLATSLKTSGKQKTTKITNQEICDAMLEVLKKQGEVRIKNFGLFSYKTRRARHGRNPGTGEEIVIPASHFVVFKPSTALKCPSEKLETVAISKDFVAKLTTGNREESSVQNFLVEFFTGVWYFASFPGYLGIPVCRRIFALYFPAPCFSSYGQKNS